MNQNQSNRLRLLVWDTVPVPLDLFQVFDGWCEVGEEVCFAESSCRVAVSQVAGASVVEHCRLDSVEC